MLAHGITSGVHRVDAKIAKKKPWAVVGISNHQFGQKLAIYFFSAMCRVEIFNNNVNRTTVMTIGPTKALAGFNLNGLYGLCIRVHTYG